MLKLLEQDRQPVKCLNAQSEDPGAAGDKPGPRQTCGRYSYAALRRERQSDDFQLRQHLRSCRARQQPCRWAEPSTVADTLLTWKVHTEAIGSKMCLTN